MNFRDTYYEEVDKIFGSVKPNPMNEKPDGNAVPQESNQPLGPVGWLETADGKVRVDADGITIIDGKINVTGPNGEASIVDGVIAATEIQAGSVTTEKLAAGAVTTAKLAAGSVTTGALEALAVNTAALAAGAVTTAKLEAGAVTTAALNASAVIQLVTNDGATVVINASGIAVTSGEITVTNGAAVVIIDGTSNMFKIAATGSTSVTAGADSFATSTVTLSGLGALPSTPAHNSFISLTNTNASNQTLSHRIDTTDAWVAATSGGAVTKRVKGMDTHSYFYTNLNGSSEATINLTLSNATTASVTNYGRYYIFKEAAI